jgi:uncharacterized protein (TIGR02246 family)
MIRIGLMLMLACVIAGPAAADDIKDLDQAFVKAMKENDIAGVTALYDEKAVLYPPDAMEERGVKAIGQVYAALLSQFRITDFRIDDHVAESEDDLAVSWGRFTMVMVPKAGGAEQKVQGRFTGVAKKKDGKWKYIADHASFVFTPPPPAKAPMK